MKKYKVITDRQTGEWCVGSIKTAEGWRRQALTWARSDGNKWAIKELKALHGMSDKETIDFIADYWDLEFERVRENMTMQEEIADKLESAIYKWVADNFGTQEAEDPSWNIEALAEHLSKSNALREICRRINQEAKKGE